MYLYIFFQPKLFILIVFIYLYLSYKKNKYYNVQLINERN